MQCALCSAGPETGETLFENATVRVLLHPDRAVRGHALVASVRHVENLADLTEAEAAEFLRIERAAERALLDATRSERVILLKLGIQTPHLHLHIYPVSAGATRAEVQRMIDAEVTETQEAGFAEAVRKRLLRLTSRAE